MKFSAIAKGTRRERPASFPYPGSNGETIECALLLRPLTDAEEIDAHAFATSHAASKGIKDPQPNNPIYDSAFMAHALACGCLDPESPASARVAFFASANEVLENLTRDQRVYVFELLESWQDECSPSIRKLSAEQMLAAGEVLAKGGSEAERFLDSLAPSMLRSFARFMGSQLSILLEPKSLPGSPSSEPTTI